MQMKASFAIFVLSALVAVTSALPAGDLVPRAKIGKPKPAPAPAPAPKPPAPAPKPPAPAPKPAAPAPKPPAPAPKPPAPAPKPPAPAPKPNDPKPSPSTCNGIKGGNTCVTCAKNTKCGFNAQSNTCVDRKAGVSLITDSAKCQQSGATDSASVKAKADELFNKMKSHIFNGEPGGKPESGRHTFSAWRQANKDAGRCDTETNICAFRLSDRTPKTVWDDRGKYSQGDVETMCKTAITLNIKDSGGKAARDGAFVVQTKFGKPICVRHQVAGSGSCFPVGIHSRANKLGSTCSEGPQDTQAINGKNVEIPATK